MAVSATSTLFYGIFVESASLLIAAKSYASMRINRAILSEIEYARELSDSVYTRVPLEIWDRIKDQLLELYLDNFTAEFVVRMSCDGCVNSNSQRLDVIDATEDYQVELPNTLEAFREWQCDDCNNTVEHVGFYSQSDWLERNGCDMVRFLLIGCILILVLMKKCSFHRLSSKNSFYLSIFTLWILFDFQMILEERCHLVKRSVITKIYQFNVHVIVIMIVTLLPFHYRVKLLLFTI